MMRWNARMLGIAAVALCGGLVGCTERLFMTPEDYTDVVKIGLPEHFENDPHGAITPTRKPDATPPPTVLDPNRPARYMTLAECFSIALEQGTVGLQQNVNITGLGGTAFNDGIVVPFLGDGAAPFSDAIQALALEPARADAEIERSLSRFDARWVNSMSWTKQDDAVVNVLQNFQNGDQAALRSALLKPLPTGGVAGITFSNDYQFLTSPPGGDFAVINPNYRPRMQVSFEQPLLQGFGVEINQLRQSHPGSVLQQLQLQGTGDGILITRLRADTERDRFQSQLNTLIANVESAYWTLYGAYFNLYAQEQALRQAYLAWRLGQKRYEAGRIAIQELAQTEGQFELFRAQRLQALGLVLESERSLRGVLGMAYEDGKRLVPAETPTLAPYSPDWRVALEESLQFRPEVVAARRNVKFQQLDLIRDKNLLLPDLRFFATYDVNGIGTQLDGSREAGNALASLAQNTFNTWQIGLQADIPLGFRDAHANLRRSRLELAQSLKDLQNQEYKAEMFLARRYQQLFESYELIRRQRALRVARSTELKARFERYAAGTETIDTLLEAQRFFAEALSNEYNAIVEYNIALSNFQFAKGTILQYNSILIAEGPLPKVAMTAATNHHEARSRALLIRERSKPPAEMEAERMSLPAIHAHEEPLPEITHPVLQQENVPLDPLRSTPEYREMQQPSGEAPPTLPPGVRVQPNANNHPGGFPGYPTSLPPAPNAPVAQPVNATLPEPPVIQTGGSAKLSMDPAGALPAKPDFMNGR